MGLTIRGAFEIGSMMLSWNKLDQLLQELGRKQFISNG